MKCEMNCETSREMNREVSREISHDKNCETSRKYRLKEQVKNKWGSRRGETLAEVLVGILFVAVASSLFLSMVTVSQKINTNTQKADDIFYKAMSQLECFESDGELVQKKAGSITVSVGAGGIISQDYAVDFYYGDDMVSYWAVALTEDKK
ncbi:hypothetical protein GPL15_22140 [Clostridium sp. MCC353]|uniref:hypothetical protein n=1 Tax=Clostridium sp. MCC353 TaxID=2592646 RepID=UPI001C0169D7|nr:hypothetical protein [Clostridium sp. MCC353]MBT9779183.1 hypothetical protein [Clostridium sp. MCC353]